MAQLAATTSGEAKARVEDDLARVLDSLATVEEDGRKSEVEIVRLAVEKASLLLELEASKDGVLPSFLGGQDKEAMDEDYQKALELIFT